MSGLGLEGGAGEVESVSIAERLKLTDNIHVMDVPGGGYILLCGIYGEKKLQIKQRLNRKLLEQWWV